jgi:hypothetical protein
VLLLGSFCVFLRGERGGEEYMGVCPWRVVRQGQGVGAGPREKEGVWCEVWGRGRVLGWSQMDGGVDTSGEVDSLGNVGRRGVWGKGRPREWEQAQEQEGGCVCVW